MKRFSNAEEELKFWKDVYGHIATAEKDTIESILSLIDITEEEAVTILKYGKDEEGMYAKHFLKFLDKFKAAIVNAGQKYDGIQETLKTKENTDKSNLANWFARFGKQEGETDMQVLNELREGVSFASIISEDKSRKGE